MDGRVGVGIPALSRCRSDEAERASKARLFEHRDVRVRAGAREAGSKGSRADTMSARPSRSARMALVTFPERKVTRAVGRRGKRHGRQRVKSNVTGSRLSPE